MASKKVTRKTLNQLRSETDKLARQAKRTKTQLDKVQDAADALVEKAGEHKPAKPR